MNPWTRRCFEKFNIAVEGHPNFGNISASRIRELIVEGKEWEHLVPKEVANIVKRSMDTFPEA
jgi:nicotinic acid mononucleotide adenylyltransferase